MKSRRDVLEAFENGKREGEIKGLMRAARLARRIGLRLRSDGYYVMVAEWCRAEAARLRRLRKGAR